MFRLTLITVLIVWRICLRRKYVLKRTSMVKYIRFHVLEIVHSVVIINNDVLTDVPIASTVLAAFKRYLQERAWHL